MPCCRFLGVMLLVTFILPALPAQGKKGPRSWKPPTKAEIQTTLKSLEAQRKRGQEREQLRLLGQALWMDDVRISTQVGHFLSSPVAAVRKAALHALRYHRNAQAFKLLQQAVIKKEIIRDDACMVEACLALGQSGRKQAISALTRDVGQNMKGKVLAARAKALAHIRVKASVDALIRMLRMGRKPRRKSKNRRGQGIYLALFLLTGHESEARAHLWKKWWEKHRSGFEIPSEPVGLTKKQERQWQRLWRKPRPAAGRARKKPGLGS